MFRRCGYVSLLAITLTMSGGCAYETFCSLRDCGVAHYRATHWLGPQCGQTYWSEWFNDPPDCCDPCAQSGYYTGGGCCSRAATRQRRQAHWGRFFGSSACGCGCGALDESGCGNGCGGCMGGCCGNGFVLGFHRFVNRARCRVRGFVDGCGDGPIPGGCGCGCGDPTMSQGIPQGEPYGAGYDDSNLVPEPAPAGQLTPPPPGIQQSTRNRSLKPAAYQDPYDDVFEDTAQFQNARPASRLLR